MTYFMNFDILIENKKDIISNLIYKQ